MFKEAFGFLVVPPVFKTGEIEHLGLAGSIPVRLREPRRPGVTQVDPRRLIPRTDQLLALPAVQRARKRLGDNVVRVVVRNVQDQARRGDLPPEQVQDAVLAALADQTATTLRPVLNATGVVVHTNLGRAPLAPGAVGALIAASGYVDVELDLATGTRSKRGVATREALLTACPAAQDALVVNNGAAALVLATTALAAGREVVVSRGELIEIGAGFRLPDLIASTGARLREVGTTNRTHLKDYAEAIGPQTGCVLKVHQSNFRVEGFTTAVSVSDLRPLTADNELPLIVDLGSGLLTPDPLLPDEPDAATALGDGADIVTASGDKLLGGPQAGWCSVAPTSSRDWHGIRWPARSAPTSSPWPRSRRPSAQAHRRSADPCTPMPDASTNGRGAWPKPSERPSSNTTDESVAGELPASRCPGGRSGCPKPPQPRCGPATPRYCRGCTTAPV